MEPDFSGWATKAGLKCSDGLTIMPDAFKHQDNLRVPLVWQHGHNEPTNVLGHAILENRPEGVYAYGYFNDTPTGKSAKTMLQHGDVNQLSIFANKLTKQASNVVHGMIREVSLVLAGANPGALIDYVSLQHSDGTVDELDDEAVIYTGLTLEHAEDDDADSTEDSDDEGDSMADKTVKDVYDSMTEEQKNVVHFMIGAALEEGDSAQQSDFDDNDDNDDNDEDTLNHQEGNPMTRNVFETKDGSPMTGQATLSHDQLKTVVEDAKKIGSFKESLLMHAADYGITNIDLLFPDAKAVTNSPEFVKRRTEWVAGVIDGTKHSPFSRIKSLFADITADEARAKGYLKGNLKKEEFFALTKRTTTPATIYKKQKLDRDDIIDITDLDVVAWLKAEMRLMLEEEMAGAVLVGDGRSVDHADKILDPAGESSGPGIRSIANDNEFYAIVKTYDSTAQDWKPDDFIDAVVEGLEDYEGSGNPTLFTSISHMNKILLQKDTLGRRLYASRAEVASLMGVSKIVDVPDAVLSRAAGVTGIIVNLQDYTLGTDRGGEVNYFDDFDIDYNQYKYLMEGRSSGALTKYHSAVVLKDVVGGATGGA